MDEAFAHLEGTETRHSKKELLPPDGGWGYLVCIGVGFTFNWRKSNYLASLVVCPEEQLERLDYPKLVPIGSYNWSE
ncbi:hypothetical protein RR46_05078 [Papilio xuthus]|uniref:Uncharacterized protein n=1 Tax=Papilio xuthus TaxID=66420 RepID=A0A194Q8X9_PAPXU|nr:hypothetical protein RR46_05078 [Papilio xuthus]